MPICCQFAPDAVPTPRIRALLSGRGQSDISETRGHAFLNTHVRKKLMLRESKVVGRGKEEKPWRLCVRKKLQRQGIQSAPPPPPPQEGCTEVHLEKSPPCTHSTEHQPALSFGPALSCSWIPWSKETRPMYFTVWTSLSRMSHGDRAESTGSHAITGQCVRFSDPGYPHSSEGRLAVGLETTNTHFSQDGYAPQWYKMIYVQGCSLQHWVEQRSENNLNVHLWRAGTPR